jgi:hypothetical protein
MKKIFLLLNVLILLVLVKFGYDIYNLSHQQNEWHEQVARFQKNQISANDQIAALQRQIALQPTVSTSQKQESELSPSQIDPMQMIRLQLDFIEFALQQQQPVLALEKLEQLQQRSLHAQLSDAVHTSLQQVLLKDHQLITGYIQAKSQQQTQMMQVLAEFDQVLKQQLNTTDLTIHTPVQSTGWAAWFKIEAVEQPAPVAYRHSILKEVQMRVLLAQQELSKGRYSMYQASLLDIIALLKTLPDAQSQQLLKQVEALKMQTSVAVPNLNTRAFIG